MRIRREWLGGFEDIDLGTRDGYLEFVHDVVQDDSAADDYVARLAAGETVVVNADQAEYVERYTPLADDPVYQFVEFYLADDAGRRVSGPYTSWEAANTDRRGAELFVDEVDTRP